jgi:hypothetical protein
MEIRRVCLLRVSISGQGIEHLDSTYLPKSHRDSDLVAIWIDAAKNAAILSAERNMFVKSFVVGAAGTHPLSKMELRAGSCATNRPAS